MSQSPQSLGVTAVHAASSKRKRPLSLLSQMLLLFSLLFGCCIFPTESLVVPHDLPTILSVIYSNIPEIKKGTDSRLGFGFRLGDHADFQILLEFGPQTYTQPIGDQDGKSSSSFNKRQVTKKEYLKALQRQQLKQLQEQNKQKEKEEQEKKEKKANTSTEQSPQSWLQNWSNGMNGNVMKDTIATKSATTAKSEERRKKLVLPTMPSVPEHVLKQLKLLHQMATTTVMTITPTSTTEARQPVTHQGSKAENNKTQSETLLTPGSLQLEQLLRLSKDQVGAHLPEDLQHEDRFEDKRKLKDQITKELMDVNLDEEE